MLKKVRKAVIPAAGLGTRFLPATKAQPKEMLPIVDKPIIQYVVEDAVSAGIQEVIMVTGWNKRTIEDHFDYPFELEKKLEDAGKLEQLEEVRRIANLANFIYLRQKGPLGNATPIMNAKALIQDEPFLVLWGDDFILSEPSRSQQLIDTYEKYNATVLGAIKTTNPADGGKYGFATGEEVEPGLIRVKDIIEKPGVGKAPSDLATVSGTLYTPDFFEYLEGAPKPKPGEEFVYIDALRLMIREKDVYVKEIQNGKYYDCGNKLEYLKANIEFALKREDFSADLKEYLKQAISQ